MRTSTEATFPCHGNCTGVTMGATARPHTITIGRRKIAAPVRRDILNPADGPLVGGRRARTASHLESVFGAAAATRRPSAARCRAARRAPCGGIARILTEDAREPAKFLSRQEGKPLTGLGWEFKLAACTAWALCSAPLDVPPKVLDASPDGRIELYREPIGVVGSIIPRKWPLPITVRYIVPVLCIGNTVVMKSSPLTMPGPLPTVELSQDALPPCVLNAVAGDDALGMQLSSHLRRGELASTGSAAAGRNVMASAVPTLKQLTLGFRGIDPGIALVDADVGKTVERAARHACINSARSWAALRRLSGHECVRERLGAGLDEHARAVPMGAGMPPEARPGLSPNEPQHETVSERVEDGKRQGGERSKGRGYLNSITLVDAVSDGVRPMEAMQCGQSPLIVRCREADEAVLPENASRYGLAASVWGTDRQYAQSVVRRLQAARCASTITPASRPTCCSASSPAPVSTCRSGRKACRPPPRSWCSMRAIDAAPTCLRVPRTGGGRGTRLRRRVRVADPDPPGPALAAANRCHGGVLDDCLQDWYHRRVPAYIAAFDFTVSGNARAYRCQLPIPVTAVRESFRCSEGV